MGDDNYVERRRTGFERDLREFLLKVVLGLLLGLAFQFMTGWSGQWWVPYLIGVAGMFAFAYAIRGSSSHQDGR